MPDVDRRRLERLAAEADDLDAARRLAADDERRGVAPVALAPRVEAELRDRAINDGDEVAEFELERRLLARHPPEEHLVSPAVTTIPPVGAIWARPSKAPLWDRETFGDGNPHAIRRFFSNPSVDAQGRDKLAEHGAGGWVIPNGYVFFLYEILGLLDAGSDPEQAEHFWNKGEFRLLFSQSTMGEWPARLVVPPPRRIPTSQLARTRMVWALRLGVDVTVQGKPLKIQAHEQWCVEVSCDGLENLPLMTCLKGIRLREVL